MDVVRGMVWIPRMEFRANVALVPRNLCLREGWALVAEVRNQEPCSPKESLNLSSAVHALSRKYRNQITPLQLLHSGFVDNLPSPCFTLPNIV